MTISIDPNRKRRPTLIATRGLPACGKSTAAIIWVSADPRWRVRINRDDLRSMGHGRRLGTGAQEAIVTGIQHNGARAALAHGTDVIVDDTNLAESAINALAKIAAEMDADFEVWDFRAVDVELCIRRDAERDEHDRVGEAVIREKYENHILNSSAAATVPAATRVLVKG
jgi:tRNA uridine 5-carbamoylmethylation protein Kti12